MTRETIRLHADSADRKTRRTAAKLIRISKTMRPGYKFKTGGGRLIIVTARTDTHIKIKAQRGKKEVSIPLENIQRMLAYFIYARIVERKELEAFHSHNSALFGLLECVFQSRAKKVRLKSLLRLIMLGVRLFFSGLESCPKDIKLITQSGWKWIMFTYFNIRRGKAWLEHIKDYDINVLLDSGAYSVWKAQEKQSHGKKVNPKNLEPINLDEYCRFLLKYRDKFYAYFVLDVVGDHTASMENLRIMEEKYKLSPLPIFHLQTAISNWPAILSRLKTGEKYDSLEADIKWDFLELEKLTSQGYPVMGIGGTVGQDKKLVTEFLTQIFYLFPNQSFHGLGVSDLSSHLWNYGFFTCDSTVWLPVRRSDPDSCRVLTLAGQRKRCEWPVEKRMGETVKTLKKILQGNVYKSTIFVGEQARLYL